MEKVFRYVSIFKLPIVLSVVFVVQNQIFNIWTKLSLNTHFLFFMVFCFIFGMLAYGPSVLLKRPARYIYLFVISAIISLIFISQYIYFSFFGGFLQASALKYAGQIDDEMSTIITLLSPRLFVFLLNILTVIIAYFLLQKEKIVEVFLPKKERVFVACGIVVITLLSYGTLLVTSEDGLQKILHPSKTMKKVGGLIYSPNDYIKKTGINNYYLSDVIGLMFRSKSISKDDALFVAQLFSQKQIDTPDKYFGIAHDKNLIIVQFESLENVVIGQRVNGQEITPNLNKLSKEGLYFNNYYTQVGPGNTSDVEFVTLNSLYSLSNTAAFIDFANNSYTALPALLKQNGYSTYTLHGNVPTFWNRSNIYPKLGYENVLNKNDFIINEKGFEVVSDADFFSQSVQKMSTFKSPFMATLITLSSHSPYIIPQKYQILSFSSKSTLTDSQKNYLQSIHYADKALGTFIADLKKNGLYDDSLIAIYGDHGSNTDINEALSSVSSNKTIYALSKNQVPLIILAPKTNTGITLKKTITTPGSHLDLYPTLTDFLGVELPANTFGQNLMTTKTPVVTRRDPYSQIIAAILTPKMAYESSESGKFEEGTCLQIPAKTSLPIMDCKKLYDEQLTNVKASDIIVKGNLIPKLSQSITPIQP
jgi:phosphoglycerol transferase MdoB-like AlkP superfamily enzyme